MEPSIAWACDRRGLSVAVSVFPVARRDGCRVEAAAVADLRPWRAAGRGRLVDGRLRPFRAHGGVAISPGDASGAGVVDLRRHRLDLAPARRATAAGSSSASEADR